jgi:hypothetical protein
MTIHPLANGARCKDFLILALQPSSFWIFEPLETPWRRLNSSATARARSHFLEAIAHSEYIEPMLFRPALVDGLPTHHAAERRQRSRSRAANALAVADAFSTHSVVDFAEFFVIEEPFEMVEAEGLSNQPSRRPYGRSSH